METLKQVLMRRDNLTPEEANEAIREVREQLYEYLDAGDLDAAENILQEEFGLEPDFLMDLLY